MLTIINLLAQVSSEMWCGDFGNCWMLHLNFEYVFLPGGRVLQIPRAQAEDAGRYMCVAVNEAGEDSIYYDVRVLCELSCFSF